MDKNLTPVNQPETLSDTLVSIFKSYSDKEPSTVTLSQVVQLIRQDSLLADQTEKHRYYLSQHQEEAARQQKAMCLCISVATSFAGGKSRAHILSWSNLSLVDFDDIPAETLPRAYELLKADPHTLLAYITIGGAGLRVIYRGNLPTDHPEKCFSLYPTLFGMGNLYYEELLKLPADEKCKNCTRLSGLAHDEQVYYNPCCLPFEIPIKSNATPSKGAKSLGKKLQQALNLCKERLEKEGISYKPHQHNEYIMRMGYLLNEYGIALDKATKWACNEFADYGEEKVRSIFTSCYGCTDRFGIRSVSNDLRSEQNRHQLEETKNYLTDRINLRQNIINRHIQYLMKDDPEGIYRNIDDRIVNTLWDELNTEGIHIQHSELLYILNSNFVSLFDPVLDYISNLPPWDGVTDYIGQASAMVHVCKDEAVFTEYFRRWFVGMIAGYFEKAKVNQTILVFLGRQGNYKTTFFNNLLPPPLREYFYTRVSSNRLTKDDLISMSEFLLICLEEIDVMDRSEHNAVKGMVSQPFINERAAYAMFKEHRRHIASFCGTGNNLNFLNDPTNTRRWLPFEVDYIEDTSVHLLPYEGMFAQGYALWQQKMHYWFNQDEIEDINRRNTYFEVPNLEEELILRHFRKPYPHEECAFYTVADIIQCISSGLRTPLNYVSIGIVMRKLGFERIRFKGVRGYRLVAYTVEEMNRNQQAMARYTDPEP